MAHPKIKFILNEPRNPKNIGAAARGMANFGFRDLAVVNPYSKAWRETRSAVNASEVVLKAKKYDSLKKAVRSAHLIVGTSAGSRRAGEGRWIGLEDLPKLVHAQLKAKKSVAVLFGSERSGLSNEDLSFCHYIVRIPTVAACPSMNLSQAVAVLAYAIRMEQPKVPGGKEIAITEHHVEVLVGKALKACTKAGLLKGWDEATSEQRFRRSLMGWNLNEVDAAILHGVFGWILKVKASRR